MTAVQEGGSRSAGLPSSAALGAIRLTEVVMVELVVVILSRVYLLVKWECDVVQATDARGSVDVEKVGM